MDALQIIIPAVTGMLGLFIGYFLKKSEYERQRMDEVADREFTRRTVIHDKRIQEAQAYLESFRKAVFLLINIERDMLRNMYVEDKDPLEKLQKVSTFSPNNSVSISLLNDLELDELSAKLHSGYNSELIHAHDLKAKIKNIQPAGKDAVLERLIAFATEMPTLINQMQIRLGKLAETVK